MCACQQNITNPHLFFFCRTTECVAPFCHGSVWFGNDEEHGQLVISLPTGFRNHTALMYHTQQKNTKISSLRILMSLKSSYLIRLNSVISLSSVCVCAHVFCVNSRYLYSDCCWCVVKDVDVVVVNKTVEVDDHCGGFMMYLKSNDLINRVIQNLVFLNSTHVKQSCTQTHVIR